MAIGVILSFPGGTIEQAGLMPDEPIIFPAHNVVRQ
jgi:hypothetical protein